MSVSPTLTMPKLANRRLAREWKTVTAMLHIYSRDQHGGSLCAECDELMRYVNLRIPVKTRPSSSRKSLLCHRLTNGGEGRNRTDA